MAKLVVFGVAHGEGAQALHQEGASHCVEDFADLEHFMACLEDAAVPTTVTSSK